MKHKNFKLSIVFLFCIGLIELKSQETTSTSGTNISGSGGSMSYTIGQIVYNTDSGTTGYVVQGVQQPYEISVITGLEEIKGNNLNCLVYPNPTNNFLILKIENYNVENLTCKLYDINGKLLIHKKITRNETTIEMKDFISSIYFLKVSDNNKEIQIFKICKN